MKKNPRKNKNKKYFIPRDSNVLIMYILYINNLNQPRTALKTTEFINSKMIYGHRYDQRFETLTEKA